ncbi:MAG TPA: glycosyltransferase family 39 protein, partial [Thermoanaerobaculia bacterium]|nr:glycosyltransferase family 39 protein [Thermoanaerobaculia bacterium]
MPGLPNAVPESRDGAAGPRRLFAATLAGTVAYKAFLAAAFPVLGDEAYLFTWAREPAWGYYDHPPLAAWLLHPLFALGLGDSLLALRLPAVLLHALLAVGLVGLLLRSPPRPAGIGHEERAYLAGSLFLLVPAHVLAVPMLTDVPLIACTFLAGAALFLAEESATPAAPGPPDPIRSDKGGLVEEHAGRAGASCPPVRGGGTEGRGGDPIDRPSAFPGAALRGSGKGLAWYAAAGVFLGLAFLAKYLAALLAVALLVWFTSVEKTRRRTLGLALMALGALPFVVAHLAWNASHCWATVLFNFYSRHAGESKNYRVSRNLLIFTGTHLYLAGPALWYLGRRWRRLVEVARAPGWRAIALAFLVPMALLALAAALLVFGAYWVLPFYPFLFLLLARVLERSELARCLKLTAAFTGAQALALAVTALLPLTVWRGAGFYPSLVTMERTAELLDRSAPMRGPETRLAARGYSLASLLSWRSGEPVAVWGEGSHYARQD